MTARASSPLWITGAGSGIGRAVAVAVAPGSRVAVSGRRGDALEETAALVRDAGGEALVLPLDVADREAVAEAAQRIRDKWGPALRLVIAAGVNTPDRSWQRLSMAEFESIVATNLTGVASVIDAALPDMRDAGDGVVVVVSSYAGWRTSASPGVAYSASKRALGPLVAILNEEEAAHGIRATLVCPGDVNSDFLAQRPVVPDADARERMLTPDDVARTIRFVLESPPHVVIDELVVSPVSQRS